jgi:tetratricopeptide (TPR) repeat protein
MKTFSRVATIARWGLVAVSAVVISFVRPVAADRFHLLRVSDDVYPLAPPVPMVVASLGYRSALADGLFASLLVSYGMHFKENRRLEFAGEYLDTINALDPTFREPYRLADTLLVIAPIAPLLEHYVKAREVLLRGLENLPYDTEVWLTAGQYLAYLAPPYLPTPEMKKAWRLEGAKTLSRACELANKNDNVPYSCITAAALFEGAGERDAAIESLKRLLAVSDDPEIERIALGYLQNKLGDRERDLQEQRRSAFRDAWKKDLPFVSKDRMLVLGPHVDTARCAGVDPGADASCASSWFAWGEHAGPSPDG